MQGIITQCGLFAPCHLRGGDRGEQIHREQPSLRQSVVYKTHALDISSVSAERYQL